MHFRKFSPVERDEPIFELVDGAVVLLDVSKNAAGALEIAFHGAMGGRVFEVSELQKWIAEGCALAACGACDA